MRQILFGILITYLVLLLLVLPVTAQKVTADDARTVAENWVALIIHQQGEWGESPTATIPDVQEFRRGDRLLGYFCPVSPQGFLVISLRRELAPVKAYSDTSNLDPYSEVGTASLIKDQMAEILDTIEREAGPVESVSSSSVTSLMEFNYLGAWDVLDTIPMVSEDPAEGIVADANYQMGGFLLSSSWDQPDPYNQWVPSPPVGSTCGDAHCYAGCGPVMAGQVMRYWAWPPYHDNPTHPYNWAAMPDSLSSSSTQTEIDAVARLLSEIGVEAGANYCNPDWAPCSTTTIFADNLGKDILDTFEDHFRYSTNAENRDRNDYSAIDWYNRIKNQINLNRPVPYQVEGHNIVSDGWKESIVGGVVVREWHMNYGWGGANNQFWNILDPLPLGNVNKEALLENIYPAQSLGSSLSGTYARQSFPYRYFDQDTSGSSAMFSAGQNLQFLPGVTVTSTGSSIRFEGTNTLNTLLFTRGDQTKGIRIEDGTMKLYAGGDVKLS